jgi:hypothetical protein
VLSFTAILPGEKPPIGSLTLKTFVAPLRMPQLPLLRLKKILFSVSLTATA